jgi:hypothetical protein
VGDDVVQGGAGLHDVVHRAEQGGVGHAVDGCGGHRSCDQANVVPAVFGHAVRGDGEHLLGFVNADDGAGRADLAVQQRCAQPGAAADVQDGVPGPQRQRRDEQFTPPAEGVGAPVIVTGLAPVGLRRRRPCWGRLGGGHGWSRGIASQVPSTSAKRPGCSTWGRCPQSGNTDS